PHVVLLLPHLFVHTDVRIDIDELVLRRGHRIELVIQLHVTQPRAAQQVTDVGAHHLHQVIGVGDVVLDLCDEVQGRLTTDHSLLECTVTGHPVQHDSETVHHRVIGRFELDILLTGRGVESDRGTPQVGHRKHDLPDQDLV